jgi:cyclic-di-GMP-binding protein
MASRLILTDCDSVPGKDKLKPRIAVKLITEMTATEVELPGSIPKFSLLIRAITCSMKIKDRLELLRRLKEPVTNILQTVHHKKIGITLPIAKEDVKLLSAVDGLLRDLICGYNSIIEEARGSIGFMRVASKSQYAEACYGSIAFQTRRLMLSYESYRPVRKGIWSQIHLLYRIADESGVETFPLQIERPNGSYKSSIEHIYKRAILIGRSDPYHFSFRGITRLFESLDEWPSMVRLSKEVEKANNNGMFIIDLSSDFPAAPYFQSSSKVKKDSFLILDTAELMGRLNDELKAVMHSIAGGLTGISQVQAFERMEILRHIVVSWGMHPVRKAEREDLSIECKIVFGLTNIFSILHPDLDVGEADEIDFDSTAEIQMVLGVFQEKFGKVIDKNAFVSSWKISNESSGGYSLSHTASSTKELRVGDVLALQKKGETGWNICIVRWAMEDDDGQLQAGVFKIGTIAEPVSMKPLESEKGFARLEYTAALHISEGASFSNTNLIVAQKTIYSPSRTLYMRMSNRDHLVVATNLVVSSRSVDVFSYRYDVKDHQRRIPHQDSLRFQNQGKTNR